MGHRDLAHMEISTEARERAAEQGKAMLDGSYPIRNKEDLKRAVRGFGRASDKAKTKAWITKRAIELDALELLPPSWDISAEEIEHGLTGVEALGEKDSDYLAHYGVLGMKWGVRKDVSVAGITDLHPKGLGDQGIAATYDGNKEGPRSGSTDTLASEREKYHVAKLTMEMRHRLLDSKNGPTRKDGPISKINDEYRNKNLSDDKVYNQYHRLIEEEFNSFAQANTPEGAHSRVIVSSSGEVYVLLGEKTLVEDLVKSRFSMEHSDTFEGQLSTMVLSLVRDTFGLVVGLEPYEGDLEQSEDLDGNSLSHYGVLGMKWGVRKDAKKIAYEDEREDMFDRYVSSTGKNPGIGDRLGIHLLAKDQSKVRKEEIKKEIRIIKKAPKEIRRDLDGVPKTGSLFKSMIAATTDLDLHNNDSVYIEVNGASDGTLISRIDYSVWKNNKRQFRTVYALTDEGRNMAHSDLNVEHAQSLGREFLGKLFDENLADDELAHYGILGMKWGVRKDRGGGGRPQSGPRRPKPPRSDIKKPAPKPQVTDKSPTVGPTASVMLRNPQTGQSVKVMYDPEQTSFNKDGTFSTKSESDFFNLETAYGKIGADFNKMNAANPQKQRVEESQSKTNTATPNNVVDESQRRSNGAMSDDELRAAINRMQMEKQYKELMAAANPQKQRASTMVKKIVADSAKQAAGQILTNSFRTVGTFAIAAAVGGKNPALANAMMKGVVSTDKKKDDSGSSNDSTPDLFKAKDKKASQPAASQPKAQSSSQNGSNTPKSNMGIPKADALVNKTAQKMTDDIMATMPKASSSSDSAHNKAVETAYDRAYGGSSATTQKILDDLAKLRNS